MNKAIPHDSAKLHVTGEARYVDDIPLPAKTLHLAFGLSSIAKGQIKSIDLSAVREAPGVVDIICILYTSPSPRDHSTARMPSTP